MKHVRIDVNVNEIMQINLFNKVKTSRNASYPDTHKWREEKWLAFKRIEF